MIKTPTYIAWINMRQRCNNQNRPQWDDYGGRGIVVCQRWSLFEHFLADMGERPAGMMLERVDNDRGYEPGNCVWTTRTRQNRNRRNNKLTALDAVLIRQVARRGASQRDIAHAFGISKSSAGDVIRGECRIESIADLG
jgi:hypothetical protein